MSLIVSPIGDLLIIQYPKLIHTTKYKIGPKNTKDVFLPVKFLSISIEIIRNVNITRKTNIKKNIPIIFGLEEFR